MLQDARRRSDKLKGLEALSVDDSGTRLVVLFLGDPHLLEGGQRGQDRATDPDGVLALWGSNDLDLHGRRSKSSQFLLHSVGNTGEHGSTTRQDDVSVEVLSDINVALHDGVVGSFVDARGLHTQERGLEQGFRATETFVTDGDDLTVRQFVALLQLGRSGSGLHFLFKVQGDVAELLLDVTDDFTFGGGGERVTTLSQDLHQVVSQVTTGQIETHNGVRKGITFVDGDSVGDTITRVQDDTGGTARSVEGQDGLNGDVHGGGVEGLEHNLSHLFSVGLGVQGGFSEQDGVFLRSNTELVVEGVMPDLLHIVPVGNDTVLDGVLQSQDTTLGLGFITNIRVLLAHTDHDTGVTRTTDDGREDGTRSVISGKSGFDHTGTVVNN
jgi:hypothetical protein